jgi:NitT/TauT family transport system ATP-binding protein
MKQRVGIARALVTQPKMLLADEPFGALDAMTREVMQAQLESLVTEFNQTVVFITHSIDEAIALGDRIAIISHRPGTVREVIEVGIERPRLAEGEITQHPRYAELREYLWNLVKDEALGAHAEDSLEFDSSKTEASSLETMQQNVNTPGGGGL